MSLTIPAIYKQGAFYPFESVSLPELAQVQVQIHPENTTDHPTNTSHEYIAKLHHALPQLGQSWTEDAVRQVFAKLFQDNLLALWYLCQPEQRELCTMLILATQGIQSVQLTEEQVDGLRFVLNRMKQESLSELDIDQCHEHLIAVDLYLSFSLDEDAIQSYLDEL